MKTVSSCPICHSIEFTSLTTCIDYTVSHEKYQIITCTNCHLTLTSPRPTDENLGHYYLSDTYISHSNKASTIIDRLYLITRKFTIRWKVNLIRKYTLEKNEIPLLDYGCGTGEFLKSCQDAGFIISGVEPSKTARDKSSATNHVKIHPSIEELEGQIFKVITLWHVLEHISEFEKIIQDLRTKLDSDGIMLIAVPNYKSFDAQHYKENWAAFDVPRHLWHFSMTTMKALLHKNQLTLIDICGMKMDAFYVSMLSEKYKSGNLATIYGYLKAFFFGIISNWKAKKSGEYSSLIYIVKK